MNSSPRRSLLAALGLVLLTAPPVSAGEVKKKEIYGVGEPTARPTIRVKSLDGKSYQTVESEPLEFKVSVIAGCNWVSTKRDLKITIGQTTKNPDFFGDVPKGFEGAKYYTIETPHMNPKIGHSPVAACNLRLQELVAEGKPSWRVLQEGFLIDREGAYEAKLAVTCGGTIQDTETTSTNLGVKIHCLPSSLAEEPQRIPPPPAPPRRNTPIAQAQYIPPPPERERPLDGKISSVALQAERPTYKGECPTSVKFRAHIVPAAPVNLGWMIEGDNGYESPEHSLRITTATPKRPSWGRTIERPSVGGGLTAEGAGKLPLIQGWAQLRVWDLDAPGGGSVRSEKVSFQVDCNPPGPAVGASLVLPQPAKPGGRIAVPTPTPPAIGSKRSRRG